MALILLDDPAHSGGSTQLLPGTSGADGTGDKARAGALKLKQWAADVNAMMAELYAGLGGSGAPSFGASVLSPSALGATANNLSPTSWAVSVTSLRITPAAGGTTVTGLAALTFAEGAVVKLTNVSSADSIVFNHDDAGSSAVNRFYCPNNAAVALPPQAQTFVTYDATSNRWRFV